MVFSSLETGFHSIAVPLRRWDDIQIAALNVGSNIERLPADDMFQRVLPGTPGDGEEASAPASVTAPSARLPRQGLEL